MWVKSTPLRPVCRFTEAKVPLGMSSPKLPLTVTRPGFLHKPQHDTMPELMTSAREAQALPRSAT